MGKNKKRTWRKIVFSKWTIWYFIPNILFLKEVYKQDEWDAALTNFGIVLAETDNISHVRDSLSDEFELKRAIDETENAIRFTQERMIVADPDTKTILNAQLEYYKNDMKQHYWGESRLETLLSEEAPKR